jgi:hypothetical protein
MSNLSLLVNPRGRHVPFRRLFAHCALLRVGVFTYPLLPHPSFLAYRPCCYIELPAILTIPFNIRYSHF